MENVNNIDEITTENGIVKEDFDMLANISILCNDTTFGEDKGAKVLLGDPTETCLVDFGKKVGFDKEEMEKQHPRMDELPFDSTRKMMTTVNEFEDKYVILTKGAVESILDKSNKILLNGKVEEFTNELKEQILAENLSMAKDALRVLACAYRITEKKEVIDKSEEDWNDRSTKKRS